MSQMNTDDEKAVLSWSWKGVLNDTSLTIGDGLTNSNHSIDLSSIKGKKKIETCDQTPYWNFEVDIFLDHNEE